MFAQNQFSVIGARASMRMHQINHDARGPA
jgi:hypothetical protein